MYIYNFLEFALQSLPIFHPGGQNPLLELLYPSVQFGELFLLTSFESLLEVIPALLAAVIIPGGLWLLALDSFPRAVEFAVAALSEHDFAPSPRFLLETTITPFLVVLVDTLNLLDGIGSLQKDRFLMLAATEDPIFFPLLRHIKM